MSSKPLRERCIRRVHLCLLKLRCSIDVDIMCPSTEVVHVSIPSHLASLVLITSSLAAAAPGIPNHVHTPFHLFSHITSHHHQSHQAQYSASHLCCTRRRAFHETTARRLGSPSRNRAFWFRNSTNSPVANRTATHCVRMAFLTAVVFGVGLDAERRQGDG